MATLIPSLDDLRHSSITEGERQVAEVLEKNLGNDCLIWFNPKIPPSNLEPDFIVLDPGKGLLIIEVKDWKIETVVEANNEIVTLLVNNELKKTTNPYKQTKTYSYEVKNQLERGKNLKYPDGHQHGGKLISPYGIGVVLTKITRAELKSHNLEAVFGSNSVFCQDEIFQNMDAQLFREKLWSLLPFGIVERLSSEQINSISQLLKLPKRAKNVDSVKPEKSSFESKDTSLSSTVIEANKLPKVKSKKIYLIKK